MVDVNCIKIRDYKPFKYKGYKIQNIWKSYDEDNPEEIFMWFDVIDPKGEKIHCQTFSRSETKKDLMIFVKVAIDENDYFMYDLFKKDK